MKLGVDIDGVVANWDRGWRKKWRQMYPGVLPEGSKVWNSPFHDTGLEPGEFWVWMDDNHVWDDLPPMPYAVLVLSELSEAHEIHFITNRHRSGREPTLRWLKNHGLHVHDLHFTRDKSTVVVDVYIDDDPVVLSDLYGKGRATIKFLHPWNTDAPATTWVNSWTAMVDTLEMMGVD